METMTVVLQLFAKQNNLVFAGTHEEVDNYIDGGADPDITSGAFALDHHEYQCVAFVKCGELYRFGYDELNEDPGDHIPTTFEEVKGILSQFH